MKFDYYLCCKILRQGLLRRCSLRRQWFLIDILPGDRVCFVPRSGTRNDRHIYKLYCLQCHCEAGKADRSNLSQLSKTSLDILPPGMLPPRQLEEKAKGERKKEKVIFTYFRGVTLKLIDPNIFFNS